MSDAPHPHFPHLFSSLTIRNLTLRNRIAISGHHAGWWVDGGLPSAEFASYIEERCRDGVGLFVIGCTSPKPGSGWLENLDDRVIPRYRMCADAAHRHGAALIAQLCHPGFGPLPGVPLTQPVPSACAIQPHYRAPERYELSREEIGDMVAAFGAAAARIAAGGCDGAELHSHEWFLHAQFLNPMWNRRRDEYGGSLENRMRFMVQTLQAMRAALGPRPVLGVRLKADDMEQRGMNADDYRECVRRLEEQKLVDYVLFTGGDARLHHGPAPRPEGEWLPLIRQHKAATRLVVMHAGRICTPEQAERAVAEGVCDVVCMTKAHIADPHFTRKVKHNQLDDIRYCTRCLQACHGAMHRMTCVYNPLTSREKEWWQLPPAARKKRVVIVGGGPAGMECAITAAARGHEVIVLEKSARVGGQVLLGAAAPMRREWGRIAEFYERQARKGVFQTRLNTPATAEGVLALNPDAVVIATGSTPKRMELGDGGRALTVQEALTGGADGAKTAIVFDGETFYRAATVADFLSARGVHVHFVTPHLRIGPNAEGWVLDEWLRQFQSRGMEFWPGMSVAEWKGSALLRDTQTGEEKILEEVDVLVGLVGSDPVNALACALRGNVGQLHVIGDANTPQTMEAATYQGARLGRTL